MADVKVNVYTPAGKNVGYFINPEVKVYPAGDYEITGDFFEPTGEKPTRIDFNPEAMPYTADLSDYCNNNPKVSHKKLSSVYVQSGRQPITMSGQGK